MQHTDGSGNLILQDDASRSTVLSNLGFTVRKQREALGFSIEEIALRTSISVSKLNAFELGDWDIDLISLDSIATCLNVKLKVVFVSAEALAARNKGKLD